MTKLYGDFSAIYDRLMTDFDYEGWLEGVKTVLFAFHMTPRNVLEVGCGTGNLTALLAKEYPVTAVDLSPDMIAMAKQKGIDAHFMVADALHMKLENTYSLIVLSSDVMHYIAPLNRLPLLRNLASHLDRGGLVIFDWRDEQALEAVDGAISIHDEEDLYAVYGYALKDGALVIDVQGFLNRNGWMRIRETHTLYLGAPELWEPLAKVAGLLLVAKGDLAVRIGEPEDGDSRYLLAFRKD